MYDDREHQSFLTTMQRLVAEEQAAASQKVQQTAEGGDWTQPCPEIGDVNWAGNQPETLNRMSLHQW